MAAFCACCGAEITLKTEACPVCGMPRHGMLKADPQLSLDSPLCLAKEPEARNDPDSAKGQPTSPLTSL
jgi:predicted amidophosphoribosyltransferase